MSFSGNYINAGNIEPVFSSTGGSANGDWYTHQQTLDIGVSRENVFNTQLSTTSNTPFVTHNRLKVSYHYTVSRDVEYSTTFGGSVRTGQTFFVSGMPDIDLEGQIHTDSAGFIRRLVRTDARTGAILDSLNDCNNYGTFYMDEGGGAYDGTFPTNLANQIVIQAGIKAHESCPEFLVTLLSA